MHDCYTVIQILELMGIQTDKDRLDPTACCELPGVECEGSNVVSIRWVNTLRRLEGRIPPQIGFLENLRIL